MARRFHPPERLGALTDGVFAIALTLLVLELKLPEETPAGLTLREILVADWHPFLGWLISFIVLARLWMIQHDTAASISRCSSRSVLINFVFLATISLVPFTAHLVGVYELSEPLALQLFSILIGLNAFTLGLFVWSAEKDNGGTTAWSKSVVHHLVAVPVIAAVTVVLASFSPGLTLIIWGVESIAVIVLVVTSKTEPSTTEPSKTE
jgi:uncharacterized membrane protein